MEVAGLHFGHGTANAFDEACWMASHVLQLAPDFDSREFDRPVADEVRKKFQSLVAERIRTRKPLAYLLGRAWFAGLCFEVDERALVPRSPLAELIVEGFSPWVDPSRLHRAVDVGTGSGCLAIALALYWPNLVVDGLDISPDALALARRNAIALGVEDRVRLFESDLLEGIGDTRYDLIISNPPYVPAISMELLPAEYRHEPALGLAAGADGLDLVRRLLSQLPDHLTPDGIAVIEVGEAWPALDALLPKAPFTWLEFKRGGEGVFLLDADGAREVARTLGGVH